MYMNVLNISVHSYILVITAQCVSNLINTSLTKLCAYQKMRYYLFNIRIRVLSKLTDLMFILMKHNNTETCVPRFDNIIHNQGVCSSHKLFIREIPFQRQFSQQWSFHVSMYTNILNILVHIYISTLCWRDKWLNVKCTLQYTDCFH